MGSGPQYCDQISPYVETIEPVDLVVISAGMIPEIALGGTLKQMMPPGNIYTIGDCVTPRSMMDAMAEGRAIGCII